MEGFKVSGTLLPLPGLVPPSTPLQLPAPSQTRLVESRPSPSAMLLDLLPPPPPYGCMPCADREHGPNFWYFLDSLIRASSSAVPYTIINGTSLSRSESGSQTHIPSRPPIHLTRHFIFVREQPSTRLKVPWDLFCITGAYIRLHVSEPLPFRPNQRVFFMFRTK